VLGDVALGHYWRPELIMDRFEVTQVFSSILTLPLVLTPDSNNCFSIVFVQKATDVCGYLTDKRRVRLKVEPNNVEFAEAPKTTTRRANIVVDNITFCLELQIGPNQKLANIR
jgi:hypothetical protein